MDLQREKLWAYQWQLKFRALYTRSRHHNTHRLFKPPSPLQPCRLQFKIILVSPCQTQTLNKNITPESEYDIRIRSSKLATTKINGYNPQELKISDGL